MLRKLNKQAQTISEYAVVLALVIAALSAMQIYTKRGLQAKIKDTSDRYLIEGNGGFGSDAAKGWLAASMPMGTNGNTPIYQYEPTEVESDFKTTRSDVETTDINQTQGVWKRSIAETGYGANEDDAGSTIRRDTGGYQKNTY